MTPLSVTPRKVQVLSFQGSIHGIKISDKEIIASPYMEGYMKKKGLDKDTWLVVVEDLPMSTTVKDRDKAITNLVKRVEASTLEFDGAEG